MPQTGRYSPNTPEGAKVVGIALRRETKAIDKITDTLGRVIQFHYYTTPSTLDGALEKITIPTRAGEPSDLVRFGYKAVTVAPTFGSGLTVVGVASGGQSFAMLESIYYPATGAGYVFSDFNSYGQARRIAMHSGMTGTTGNAHAPSESSRPSTTGIRRARISRRPTSCAAA